MASATLTILGLYNYVNAHEEPDLFQNLVLPNTMVRDVLVNNILMQAAPFEMVYPDPDILRGLVGVWSNKNIEKWNRWADSWTKANAFNQLENFDRTETETIAHTGKDENGNTQTRNLAGSNNRTANLTDAETRNLTDAETRNLTDEHKVSAYDSSDYQNKDRDTHTGTDNTTHTGTDNITHTGTDNIAMTDTGTIKDEGSLTYGHNIGRNARFHGNIGVTSLAQLLTGYDEAAENWDLYALITNDFIREFCVMVY
ncbi:MAG: hypothetical protein J6S12_01965 [Alphaproteobacteria bacterium]|nr:hypothetical protein [Alphaproteobacteria bacterium]